MVRHSDLEDMMSKESKGKEEDGKMNIPVVAVVTVSLIPGTAVSLLARKEAR